MTKPNSPSSSTIVVCRSLRDTALLLHLEKLPAKGRGFHSRWDHPYLLGGCWVPFQAPVNKSPNPFGCSFPAMTLIIYSPSLSSGTVVRPVVRAKVSAAVLKALPGLVR